MARQELGSFLAPGWCGVVLDGRNVVASFARRDGHGVSVPVQRIIRLCFRQDVWLQLQATEVSYLPLHSVLEDVSNTKFKVSRLFPVFGLTLRGGIWAEVRKHDKPPD